LHQGSTLNPYLFTQVMDEPTRTIQDEICWCMFFANDIILVHEIRCEVNVKLEIWKYAQKSKSFQLSQRK